jgi:uncharacterized membrane protein
VQEKPMSAQKIDKGEWVPFFDTLTRTLVGVQAEVEVASLDLGDQIENEWQPLIGIAYDHKNDLIEIALDSHDHVISSPREVYVDYGVGGLAAIAIVDAEEKRQIVKLKELLALPAPRQRAAQGQAR